MDAVLNGPFGSTQLTPNASTMGRASDNQVVVNDGKASSRHAEIRSTGQGYTVTDLGSTNGTVVNGQRLEPNTPRPLQSGDTIRIGDTTYTFEVRDSSQAPTAYAGSNQGEGSGYAPTQAASSYQASTPATGYGGPPIQGQSGAQNYMPTQAAQPYPQYNQNPQGNYTPPPPAYDPYNPAPAQQQSYTPPPPSYNPGGAPPPYVPNAQSSYGPGGQPSYSPGGTTPYDQAAQAGYQPQPGAYIPPVPPQQPPRRQRRGPLPFILGGLAVLLVISGLIILLVHNNQVTTDNNNATATATTHNHATATAVGQANVTATAVSGFTTATAVANANPYTGVGSTKVLDDPLKDNSQGEQWYENSTNDTVCKFSEGSYQVGVGIKNTIYTCSASGTNYSDFVYEVTMNIREGDCGGFAFRVSGKSKYVLQLCQEGSYSLYKYSDSGNAAVIDTTSSTAIRTGVGQSNTIAIVAKGSNLQVYINKTQLKSGQDSSYTEGSIGLSAAEYDNVTVVAFTDAKVWKL